MPTFTIHRDGQTDSTVQLDGDRIEMGSANTCQVFIDDLLISLHQAVFIRTESGYDVEPLAKTPQFKLNGQPVTSRTPVTPGSTIEVEGYTIKIDMEGEPRAARQPAASPAPAAPPKPVPAPVLPPKPTAPSPPISGQSNDDLPPLPPPLDLEALSTSEKPAPAPPPPPPAQPGPPAHPASDAAPQSVEPPPPPPLEGFDDPSQKTEFFAAPVGQLVATQGPLKGRSYPMRAGEMRIGRDQEKNDVVIRTDAKGEIDKSISRRHASVFIEGSAAYVEDQGSVAGTFLNGQQLAPKQKTLLKAGDQIEIRSAKESTVFRVELAGQPSPPTPSPAPAPEPRPVAPPPTPSQAAPPPPPPPQPKHQPEAAQSWSAPQYERAEPVVEPEEDRARARRRRRTRTSENVNPFEQVGGGGGMSDVPVWAWIAIAAVLIAVILVIIFFVL
ncbi:MAG: hypothetical protein Kow0074_09260 [Candidatus Zixiibacteriota bacterium]